MREDTAPERGERHQGLIVTPWHRGDVPADLRIVARFVAHFGADHDRPRTSQARWATLRLIQHEIGAGPLDQVSLDDFEDWWFGAGQMRKDGAGKRSAATRRALLDHLRAFIRWAIVRGLRADDPTRQLQVIRIPRREPRPADRAEVDRVLAGARGSAQLAIRLAADLGLRCCEIGAIARGDLVHDDQGWSLRVVRKGGHELSIVMPKKLAEKLAKVSPGKPLVPSRTGTHLTARGVSQMIARTFKRADSPIRAHALRHLAATELLAAGADLVAVADQLGHRDVRTTSGYIRPHAGTVRGILDRRPTRRKDTQ